MKVALFGGSGLSGKYILAELLKRKYKVKALVRKKDSLKEFNTDNLEIIVGDALDSSAIQKTISNCTIVISSLGQKKGSQQNLLTESMKLITDSMNQFNIKRLICLTGAGVYMEGDKPSLMDKWITFMIKLLAKPRFIDGENMTKVVMSSNLEWTIVRTQLQQSKDKGGDEHIGMLGDPGQTWKCSRGFISRFIVDCITDSKYIRTAPKISD